MAREPVIYDYRFLHLTLPTIQLERLCTGMLWTEGPVYFPHGEYLLWSDIPNNRMLQWIDNIGYRVFRENSNKSNGKTLRNSRVFTEIYIGASDGFRLDVEGNIWTSTGAGVQCFTPEAALLGEIPIDEMVSILTFGGPKNNRLYITATTSLYAIYVGTRGAV